MNPTLKVIIKRPDEKYGHSTNIGTTNLLKNLQAHVEGYVEAVTVEKGLVILCNEDGRLRGLEHNCCFDGIDFVGTIIGIGADGEEFTDIPISFQEWKERIG